LKIDGFRLAAQSGDGVRVARLVAGGGQREGGRRRLPNADLRTEPHLADPDANPCAKTLPAAEADIQIGVEPERADAKIQAVPAADVEIDEPASSVQAAPALWAPSAVAVPEPIPAAVASVRPAAAIRPIGPAVSIRASIAVRAATVAVRTTPPVSVEIPAVVPASGMGAARTEGAVQARQAEIERDRHRAPPLS
jgi:hypothetical protein